MPFAADTARTQLLRPGVSRWYIQAPQGPWAIHALVVDRDACYSARAVKGADGASGRATTSALLERMRQSADVVGGVNADFFLFAPPGVPMNLLVSRGRVVTGPSTQPVLAFDSLDAPYLDVFDTLCTEKKNLTLRLASSNSKLLYGIRKKKSSASADNHRQTNP